MHTSTWICLIVAGVAFLIGIGIIIYSLVKRDSDYIIFAIVAVIVVLVMLGLAFFGEEMQSLLVTRCDECGKYNAVSSKYCDECGATNDEAPRECDSCGNQIENENKFCTNCGEAIE